MTNFELLYAVKIELPLLSDETVVHCLVFSCWLKFIRCSFCLCVSV